MKEHKQPHEEKQKQLYPQLDALAPLETRLAKKHCRGHLILPIPAARLNQDTHNGCNTYKRTHTLQLTYFSRQPANAVDAK